jgi:outer membrane murein-binding lipoprotein Lpp
MNREEFREKAKKGIDELFAKIEELEAKSGDLKEKSKVKYREIMAEIKEIEAELEAKYKKLEESGDSKWADTKAAFSKSAEAFKEAFQHLTSLFKNQPRTEKNDKAE